MPLGRAGDHADLAVEPATHLRRVVDGLDLGVVVERVRAELAAVAGLLEAAERRRHPHRGVRVDRQHAGLDRARDAQRLGAVARPDRARQPVDRVVGERDRLLLVAERHDDRDRAEDLLAHRAVVAVDRAQHGRREPVARARRARVPRIATGASSGTNEATVSRWPAEISGPISVASSSGSPTRIASTASSSASMNASSAERSTRIRERAQQSWPALPNTAPGAAAAAACEVGVGEHDVGRLAAQLERHALDRLAPRRPRSERPTSVEPVNATFATSGCSTSRAPAVEPGPDDDVDDALREPGLERDPLELAARSAASARRA